MPRWIALIAAALLCAASTVAHAERRVALIIGNDAYQALPKLQKAAADASAYADLLQSEGFDSVMLKTNLSRSDMDQAIAVFLDSIQPGDTAVFAYSGHGWSDGTQNFIVGTDAPVTGSKEFLARISIPLRNGATGVIDDMDRRGAAVKVAIIDACRDNPFQPTTADRSVGLSRGLVRIDPPKGTFVVFSASPGQTALDRLSDNDADPNSVFTRTFVPFVRQGLTLQEAVKEAQTRVADLAQTIGHDQRPSYIDEILGETCLSGDCRKPEQQPAVVEQQAPVTPAAPPPAQGPDHETLFWTTIVNSTNPDDFEAYLAQFPTGTFARLAQNRLATLRAAQQAAAEPPSAPPAEPSAEQQVAVAAPDLAPEPPPQPQHFEDLPVVDQSRPLERTELAELQRQLARIGCFSGSVDGVWGQRSRRALGRVNDTIGLGLEADEPTYADLEAVTAINRVICRPETVEPPRRAVVEPPPRRQREAEQPARNTRRQVVRERERVNNTPRQRCVANNVEGPAIGRHPFVLWGTNTPCRP